jgi:hypothetical protein
MNADLEHRKTSIWYLTIGTLVQQIEACLFLNTYGAVFSRANEVKSLEKLTVHISCSIRQKSFPKKNKKKRKGTNYIGTYRYRTGAQCLCRKHFWYIP